MPHINTPFQIFKEIEKLMLSSILLILGEI